MQKGAKKYSSFPDFVEKLLMAERESRSVQTRDVFARIACFPAVKTLDHHDFTFAGRANGIPIRVTS